MLTGQYFSTWGSLDAPLFAANPNFSPNSNGYVAEIALTSCSRDEQVPCLAVVQRPRRPQYTYYTEFDGDKVNPHANNTLFLFTWLAL